MPITRQQLLAAKEMQDAAAHDPNSKIRLVAGPGTGKSFAIEGRVGWLINNQGVPPDAIKAISFTRAAAKDLNRRISHYCSTELGFEEEIVNQLRVSTLHSLVLYILKRANIMHLYPSEPIILDSWESKNIFDAEFASIQGIIPTRAEEVRQDHEAYWSTFGWDPPNLLIESPVSEELRAAFRTYYFARTQLYSCVLPGEVVRRCVDLMVKNLLDPLEFINIQHLIVDEAQDLNPCDFEFINQLIERDVSVFVSGDDDQSIYSFRHAFPQGIQDFVTKYPGSSDHLLGECFRSTTSILGAGLNLIQAFPALNRIPKVITSLFQDSNPPNHGYTRGITFASANAESLYIANSCETLIASGVLPRDIMILIGNKRTLAKQITDTLTEAGIAFEYNQTEKFLDSNPTRFVIALLRVLENPEDYVARRVILGCPDGVGIATCRNVGNKVIANNLNFRGLFDMPRIPQIFNARELAAINKTRANIQAVVGWDLTNTIEERIGEISDVLEENFSAESLVQWTNFIQSIPGAMRLSEFKDYLRSDSLESKELILQKIMDRVGDGQIAVNQVTDKIKIMTFHGSKGLDAKVVFIPGLEQGVFPSAQARQSPGRMLEAARMLYVAITRAKAACILSRCRTRILQGRFTTMPASEFCVATGIAYPVVESDRLPEEDIGEILAAIENHGVEAL